jgi:putative lipoic acid-binding regulatory protein
MDRDSALALLRSQHAFPGPFEFRVVVRPPVAAATISAMVAAAGSDAALEELSERHSSGGKYVALHVRIRLSDAERVLDVYEVLRGVDGVMASL